MIKERFMVTGKRIDNGAVVQGYLFVDDEAQAKLNNPEERRFYIVTWLVASRSDICNATATAIRIDPPTVEPVAVKPQIEKQDTCYRVECPNCEGWWVNSNNVEEPHEYCCLCGQRLDWSEK